ncbi:8381_t:CDS:2 [Gigaspora margarita]|uniref:8381_t:CDS:1 n=1 Tax=Gigaspora margarita TaxID=4874 RepID=A0ABN7W4R7_GIGMA|nr:8381_t:CDS:2 [Gigaspora margarita]
MSLRKSFWKPQLKPPPPPKPTSKLLLPNLLPTSPKLESKLYERSRELIVAMGGIFEAEENQIFEAGDF